MNTLGTTTTTIIKSAINGLHLQFTVGATAVNLGQPVKLDATGKIVPLGATDKKELCIGTCIHTAAVGALATVAMKGRVVVNALSSAALTPVKPVKYASFDSTTGKCKYATIGTDEETLAVGWPLTVADGADDEIEVVLI